MNMQIFGIVNIKGVKMIIKNTKHKEIINIVSEFMKPFPVYITGGFVRDSLLNVDSNDIDFCTPSSPEEIENKITSSLNKHGDHRKAIGVGKSFGCLKCKILGEAIDIVSFRNEKYVKGSRKPEVNFVKDITADLSRRDLTINAIAMRDGKIIDPFNGQQDLKDKIIRCVGKPTHRFKEDPLRMLRAGRFASQLGFDIECAIYKAVKDVRHKILQVSKERWMIELDKILMTDKPSTALDFFMETGLMNFIIPALSLQYKYDQNSAYHTLDLWSHTSKALDATPKDITLRWAILLHDVGKPFVRTDKEKIGICEKHEFNYTKTNYIKHDLVGAELVEQIARHLKWSNDRRIAVVDLVKNHLRDDSPLKEYDMKGK